MIQDTDLPVCLHIGLKFGLEDVIKRDPTPMRGIFIPMVQLATSEALGMWVLTGVLERHPYLKLVFVEPGVGWVARWLNQVDDMMARQGYEFPGIKHAPSHYFHRNVHLTFIDEPDVIHDAPDSRHRERHVVVGLPPPHRQLAQLTLDRRARLRRRFRRGPRPRLPRQRSARLEPLTTS